MKEWDSMGISEDWSKSRRSPKKLSVVLSHWAIPAVIKFYEASCAMKAKKSTKKSAAGSKFVFSLWAVGFFSRRQSSSVTSQNNSWYAFLLKTDDLVGNALENYVRS